jgi:hypothetical protein
MRSRRGPVREAYCLMAILAALTSQAYALPPQDARQFVIQLYERYRNPDTAYMGDDGPLAFTPSLLRQIRKDEESTPVGYAPNVDWDPLCGCQDAHGLSLTSVDIHPITTTTATAAVSLSFSGGDRTEIELDLTRRQGVWRVSEVRQAGGPRLTELLKGGGR